jgi:hypothetical protein
MHKQLKSRSIKKNLNTHQNQIQNKPIDKVNAYTSVQLGISPFLIDDIFKEPSKRFLDSTIIEYIPFQTYDLWALDRIQAIINNSATTSSIISQKVSYFMGDGYYSVASATLDPLPSVRKQRIQEQIIDIKDEITLNAYLENMNPENESIDELTLKIMTDFISYGNAFIEISKVKVGGTKKYNVRLLPITWCRPKKANKYDLYPTHIGVSSEFEMAWYTIPKDPVDLPIFPNFEEIDGVERSIFHLKNYDSTLVYWGLPEWISAKIWAELEYRIPKFNQSKFENGFTPSAIVNLYGSTNQEEAQELVSALKNCFTGTGNNSKMFIQALRDETYKADVQILSQQNEGEFTNLQKMAQESIVSAHRWTIALTGLRTPGSLGSNQLIRSEFEIVYNTVIRPLQRMFLSKFLNPVLQDAGTYLGYNWSNIALDISKPTPVSFMADLTIDKVLTLDEQRQELGFAPLQKQENLDTDAIN